MISFILRASFDPLSVKEDMPFKIDRKIGAGDDYVNSYEDSTVLLKHNGNNHNLCVKTINNNKYLAYVSIFDEDRLTLINKLNISSSSAITDSELMLKFYLKYGRKSFDILEHGFAFILIDYSKEEVFAFRDHIGIKNICYYHDGDHIYISSSFKNIFILGKRLDFSLNLKKIKNFLNFNDKSSEDTFINEINKIPPLFVLRYSNRQIKIFKYLDYNIKNTLGPANKQIDGLRDLLKRSILVDKTNNFSKIGFLMSGGIDSSTVISFFRKFKKSNHKIYSFSAEFRQLDKGVLDLIDESGFQDEINKSSDIHDINFSGTDESTLSNIDFYLEIVGQPFFFPNLYLPNKAFSLASDKRVCLVMNGNDGDSVISHGYEYLQELFYSFQWLKLYKEIDVTSKLRKQSRTFIFKRIIYDSISLKSFFRISAKKIHLNAISSSNHSKAIEIQSLLADYYGIDERYPFYNKKLIEYCLSVSPDLKNKYGQSRYILKEAIKTIVPEKIRKRVTKANLGHALCWNFVNKDYEFIEMQISKPNPIIDELVNMEDLRRSWENMKTDTRKYATRSSVPSKIFSYVVLNRWLNRLPQEIIKKT